MQSEPKYLAGLDEGVVKNIAACKQLSKITRTLQCTIRINKMVNNYAIAEGGYSFCSPPASTMCQWRRSKERWNMEAYAYAEPKESPDSEKADYKYYQALMRGGEEVTEMMKEMAELVRSLLFAHI
jgi:hypothetical protein